MAQYTVEVKNDEFPPNPRVEYDNLATLALCHSRYNLGDLGVKSAADFNSTIEFKNYLVKELGAVVIVPVFMYDHSGISLSTKPFTCPWDSSWVGFAYITKEKLLAEFGGIRATPALKTKAESIIIQEVQTYNEYLSGECYYYRICDEDNEEVESCYGFYGFKYCAEAATEALQSLLVSSLERGE